MQQQGESEKEIRRTPSSSPRFSRTFDMLLSRVRLIIFIKEFYFCNIYLKFSLVSESVIITISKWFFPDLLMKS